jgi:hypothetical protein
METCLIIGNSFANIMQVVVLVLAISSLFIHKILVENNILNIFKDNLRRRTWPIWFMDNLKQGISTFIAHWWAVFISVYLGSDSDECGIFFIQFMIDTLIGLLLSFVFSKASIKLLDYFCPNISVKWFTIGNYSSYVNYQKYLIWLVQCLHWCLCSMLARIICSSILILAYPKFLEFNEHFSNQFVNNRHTELLLVTLIIPLIIDTFQFLIQNWFLRFKNNKTDLDLVLIARTPDYA